MKYVEFTTNNEKIYITAILYPYIYCSCKRKCFFGKKSHILLFLLPSDRFFI